MNKKGFTLVEIIVTIGLLALLGVVIGFSLNKVLKNQDENTYEIFIEKVKSASTLYISNNSKLINDLESNKGYILITINDLISNGYLREDLTNPKTGEKIKDLIAPSNTNEEDYSQTKAYYSMDKEMLIKYPYIKPKDDIYLNVINYTTMYGTSETGLCYKGLNNPSLGLIKNNGDLLNILVKENSIQAYMEDGTKCTDDILNTSKVGMYKIRYAYTIDGTNAENNPNAKSATRNIIIKPTKPKIDNFEVKYQYDVNNSNFNPYNLKLVITALEPGNVNMKYCLVAINESQNISDISKLISNCKDEQKNNQINNYWTDFPNGSNTVNINFNLKERFEEQKSAKTLKFYIFVKNAFEEYDSKSNLNGNGEIYLYKTVTINPNGGIFSDSSTQSKIINVDYGTTFNTFFDNNSTYKNPSRSNHAFEGWLLNESKIKNSDKILNDLTLKAKWYKYCTETVRSGSGSCSVSCGGGSRTVYYEDKYYGVSCSNGSESCNTHACPTTTTKAGRVCIGPVGKQYKFECDCYMGDGIPMLIWYDNTYCYCCRSNY